jgi:hypothetical protein
LEDAHVYLDAANTKADIAVNLLLTIHNEVKAVQPTVLKSIPLPAPLLLAAPEAPASPTKNQLASKLPEVKRAPVVAVRPEDREIRLFISSQFKYSFLFLLRFVF